MLQSILFVLAASVPQAAPAAGGATTIDLTPAGIPGVISVPAGTKFRDAFGDAELKNAPRFQLVVHPSSRDIAKAKAEIAANTVNKLKRWITDAPDALVYESAVGRSPKSEFHFLANVPLGARTVSCEDEKGPFFSLADVQAMLAACRTLKATGAAAAKAPAKPAEAEKRAFLSAEQQKQLQEAIPALFGETDPKLKVARFKAFANVKKGMYCDGIKKKVAGVEGNCALLKSGYLTLPPDSPVLSGYRFGYDRTSNLITSVADLKPEFGIGGFRDTVVPLLEAKWGKGTAMSGGRTGWVAHKNLNIIVSHDGGHWQIQEIYPQ
jgi:hypothetical protein